MRRRGTNGAVVVLSSLLCFVGLVGLYAQLVLFDADAFADRATGALDDPAVQEQIRGPVAFELSRIGAGSAAPDDVTAALAENPAFRRSFAAAVAAAHRTLIDREAPQAILAVRNVGLPLRTELDGVSPGLGSGVPDNLDLVIGGTAEVKGLDLLRALDSATTLAMFAGLAGVFVLGASLWRGPNKLAAARTAALAVAVAGLGLVAVYAIGSLAATAGFEAGQASAIAEAVYGAVAAPLLWLGVLTAGAGVAAAIGAGLLRPPTASS